MELVNKIKEISSSIIPILILVTIMHFFIALWRKACSDLLHQRYSYHSRPFIAAPRC